jgi:uncharacterized iron-regulated membrane protein
MKSSETSNPYDALVASMPAVPLEDAASAPPVAGLLPLALAFAVIALAAAVLWRKRQAIARAIDRKAVAAVLATETTIGFLWFTGHLGSENAARYAIAAPITLALLRTAWRIARP